MKNNVELMNLFWTTAGIPPGGGEISRFDFKDRVEAAAKAGFAGIGIWHTDLEHILQQRSLKEMKTILDDNGIKYLELEFLTDWFLDGARKAESDSRKRRLLEASAALHAKHVKIGDFDNTAVSHAPHHRVICRLVQRGGGLRRDHRFRVYGFGHDRQSEGCSDTGRNSRREEWRLDRGYRPCDDCLEFPYEEISRIPLQYLINVELNDGTLPGSPNHDPSRARRFCGEGEFDIKGFIAVCKSNGLHGSLGS